MLNYELLIQKGFKLNQYPEGKYYEFITTNESEIEKILIESKVGYDASMMDEKVILQLAEDFSNKLICVEGNVWDLTDCEFENILRVM